MRAAGNGSPIIADAVGAGALTAGMAGMAGMAVGGGYLDAAFGGAVGNSTEYLAWRGGSQPCYMEVRW